MSFPAQQGQRKNADTTRQKGSLLDAKIAPQGVTIASDFALDDVVINNQVGRWPESGRAMLRRDARRYAPRREELGVQEHAASQMGHPQDVG
jgi:hypothetical protein